MNIEEANDVLKAESGVPFGRLATAAAVLCKPENSGQVSLTALVECMRRGDSFGRTTIIHEYAALALYSRTGRERSKDLPPYGDFITDSEDWLRYLKARKLI